MITVELEDILEINEAIAERDNEESIVINKANILSALGTQQWYDNNYEQAAALIRSLTIGHRFQDGNKRTAACAGTLVQEFECTEDEVIDCILSIATG